jgi:hypothetical protein
VEFRCRLASPNGEIVEGVYLADSEARLRHELEEKGLFVLSLQPKNAVGGISLQLPQRKGINTREFLVFNQELATLLKAGVRWSSRSTAEAPRDLALVPPGAGRRHERCDRAPRCRTPSTRTGAAPSVYRVVARRRAQRQPGRDAATLRRVHEDHPDRET